MVLAVLGGCSPQLRYTASAGSTTQQQTSSWDQNKTIEPDFSLALEPDTKIVSTDENRLRRIIGSYVGVPYKSGGLSRKGLDCSGYVTLVYRDYNNLKLPRNSAAMYTIGNKIKTRDLQCGDLVFFKGVFFGSINHVGMYVGDGWFAHASTSSGVMYSAIAEDYYRKRFVGARRVL